MTMVLDVEPRPGSKPVAGRLAASLENFDRDWFQPGIIRRFCEIAARHPDRVAVDDGDTRLSYQELRNAALNLAGRIARSVPADRVVGILLTNQARFPLAMLACIAAGRIYVPLDPASPTARNRELVEDAGVGLILADRDDQTLPIDGLDLLEIDSSPAGFEGPAFDPVRQQAPMAILYTSGSTNRPKAVCYDERAILERVAHEVSCCALGADDRIFLISSVSTIASLRAPLSAFLTGATLCIANPQRDGISATIAFFAERQVTYGFAVPSVLRSLLSAIEAPRAFRDARVLRVGGDVIRASDLELCRAVLPASCSIFVTLTSTEMPAVFEWCVPPDWRPDGARVPVGYPRREIGFEVHADDGKPVGPGETGELVVRSPFLALGYWRRAAVEHFERPGAEPKVRVFSTGDLVRIRPDGLVEMVGRKDRQVKIRGLRVSPAEVEAMMQECEGVADVAVIARTIEPDSSVLIAYVVPHASAKLSLPEELRRLVAARLPEQMVPSQIRLITAIPRLSNGKQNHEELVRRDRQDRIMMDAGAAAVGRVSKNSANSSALDHARIRDIVGRSWAAVLSRRSFQADVPFDKAGGDSLGAMQVWLRIEEELKTRLPLSTLEIGMTPSQLVAAIQNALHSSAADASSPRPDQLPLIFFMPPYDGDAPVVARFRALLADRFRFAVIEYPSWREMAEAGPTFELIVDRAVDQVLGQRQADEVFVAGYSFGGCVAWEVARRLERSGVQVKFVALIDSRLGAKASEGSTVQKARRLLHMLVEDHRNALESFALGLAGRLIDRSAFATLRAASRVARMISPKAAFVCDWHLTNQVRLKSLAKWTLGPAKVPAALFCSDEVSADCPDLGWGTVCEQLSVIPVGGSHFSILTPPHREVLCERFAEVVSAAAEHGGKGARNVS